MSSAQQKLRNLLQAMAESASSPMSLLANVVPVTTLGSPPAGQSPTPAQLELTGAARELVGTDVETYVLTGDGRLRVWLAMLDRLGAGAPVSLIAVSETGEVRRASTVLGDTGELQFDLEWPDGIAPGEIGLVIGSATIP